MSGGPEKSSGRRTGHSPEMGSRPQDTPAGGKPATLTGVGVAVSWTRFYPAPLDLGVGQYLTRSDYIARFKTLGRGLRLPWQTDDAEHWSWFWSRYLGKPEQMHDPSPDAAWERVVPFCVDHGAGVGGPTDGVETDILLYPAAVSVIVRIPMVGSWPLAELGQAVAELRTGKQWTLTRPGEALNTQRSLDGIADDLGRAAAARLTGKTAPEPSGPPIVLSVVTPYSGQGAVADFAVTDPAVAACLAGLAELGPPCTPSPDGLPAANDKPAHAARTYVLDTGHAIWHAGFLAQPPAAEPLACLHRNHTDLVTHIAALGAMATWAAGENAAGRDLPNTVKPLAKQTAARLRQLHDGPPTTYRAEVARRRIEPLLPTLAIIDALP